MSQTTELTNGFILAEMNGISGRCPTCKASIKTTNDANDQPLLLAFGYRIRTIEILGGRYFEKVDQRFLHVCPPPAVPQTDGFSFVGIPLSQSALL